MYLRPKRRRAAALQRVALDFGRLYFGVRWPGSALARLPSHAVADRVASLAIVMYLRPKRRRAAALQRVALDFGRLYFGVRWPGSALARLPSHALPRIAQLRWQSHLTNLRPKRRRAAALQRAALQSWRDFKPSQRAFQTQ